jgi:cell division protein FtsN
MDRRTNHSGYELVLDVRRMIVAFALLTLVCGAFFVLGFVEGKRQVVQVAAVETGQPAAAESGKSGADLGAGPVPEETAKDADKAVREQLDWYDNVSVRKTPQANVAPKAEVAAAPSSAPAPPPVAKAQPAAAIAYSCQVGAFKQSKEAETKAASLKSRGYTTIIEPPSGKNKLFLLKVGQFGTRSEAVAMQLRLKKDGISSFIKSNR